MSQPPQQPSLWDDLDSHLFDPITTNLSGEINVDIPTLRQLRRQRQAMATARAEIAEMEQLDKRWKPGELLTLVTYRYFSVYRAIIYWAATYGPVEMTASTWAMSEQAAIELQAAIAAKQITRLNLLVDFHTFQNRAEGIGYLTHLSRTNIGITKQHAKVTVLAGRRPLTIITTANMNENQRIEVTILSDHPDDAHFHAGWMKEEIDRTKSLIRPDGTLDGRKWRFNKARTP